MEEASCSSQENQSEVSGFNEHQKSDITNALKYCKILLQNNGFLTNNPASEISSASIAMGKEFYNSIVNMLAKRMCTPKTKSTSSNLQFVCEMDVAISLERLIDSVVMEAAAQRSAFQRQQVNESNDDSFDIDSLRDEIILEVFGYLKQNQLGRIARVCKRWNMLTKCPALWKKVDVKFPPSHRSQTALAKSLINGLPSSVTSIRLNFMEYVMVRIEPLDFRELCVVVREKCPHLYELILVYCEISVRLSSVIDFCSQFLQDVKNLIFLFSKFLAYGSTSEYFGISKIEILGLLSCVFDCSTKPPFSRMPNLKQLNLYISGVNDSCFEDDTSFLNQLHMLDLGWTDITAGIFPAIQNHGLNLKELYLCSYNLQDYYLTFTESAFPRLEIICLSHTRVTCEGVVSLLQSCPSLENVYVDEHVAKSFAAHPFVVANKCKSGIVKAIDWVHNHKVDYLHKWM